MLRRARGSNRLDVMVTKSPRWLPPPDHLSLREGEVHVWAIPLTGRADAVERLESVLAPEELKRAARFRFAADRGRFVVAHGAVRCILGRYLDASPHRVRLASTATGKPIVDPTYSSGCSLQFNLSHSDQCAVLAVSTGSYVGIDIERIRPLADLERLSSLVLCADEMRFFARLEHADRERVFFQLWTRKEAIAKALGEGFALSPKAIYVIAQRSEVRRARSVSDEADEASRWSLHELPLGPDYAATLAVDDPRARVSLWALAEKAPAQDESGLGELICSPRGTVIGASDRAEDLAASRAGATAEQGYSGLAGV